MEELAKTFKNFVYRDLFYILSGALILLCIRAFRTLRIEDDVPEHTAIILLYIGFAYALGFANQELWSQTPVIKTYHRDSYNGWLRGIYRRHTGREWAKGDDPSSREVCDDPDYLRTVNVKQLGSSVGTALLTCSMILGAAAFRGLPGALPGAAMALALGCVFIHVSWLHNMRQTAFAKRSPEPRAGIHDQLQVGRAPSYAPDELGTQRYVSRSFPMGMLPFSD